MLLDRPDTISGQVDFGAAAENGAKQALRERLGLPRGRTKVKNRMPLNSLLMTANIHQAMAERQIQQVAVIGAGISDVMAAGHLIAAGFEVVIFERNNEPGGVW